MMKLIIFIACCFISTTYYSVEGGLVKDFFGKVKDTAVVIHNDVKQVWRPESTTSKETDHGEHTVPTTVASNEAKDNTPEKKEDSKVSEINSDVNQKTPDGPVSSTSTTVKENKHEETTTVSPSTTTVKDERANFSGGCQVGYKRTSDGRCMATI